MDLPFNKTDEYKDLLKSRIESLRWLSSRTKKALLNAGVRTVGGIVRKGDEGLIEIKGLGIKGLREIKQLTVFKQDGIEEVRLKIEAEGPKIISTAALPETISGASVNFQFSEEDDIIAILAKHLGFTKEIIDSHTRKKEIVRARDMIVYLLREYASMSYPVIGQLIGGRDHTTIIHAYRKIKSLLETKPIVQLELAGMIEMVKSIKEKKDHIQNNLIPEILSNMIIDGHGSLERALKFKEIPERNYKILETYREGLTLQNISDLYGVTRERVRQIVIGTIKQMATNDSLTKGIVLDADIMLDEENKKRNAAKLKKKPVKIVEKKEKRWSRYYLSCQSCGTTAFAHIKHGLCEKCVGNYRGNTREQIISDHLNICSSCGITRQQAIASHGRDFYITKSQEVLCRKCFLHLMGKKLGNTSKARWRVTGS